MQIKYIPPSPSGPAGLLQKVVTAIVMIALAGVALMFSVVLLTAILIIAIIGGAYLWWKIRGLRRMMKNFQPPSGFSSTQGANMERDAFKGEVFEGEVVEGEVIRVESSRPEEKR